MSYSFINCSSLFITFVIIINLILLHFPVHSGSAAEQYTAEEERNAMENFRPMVKDVIYKDYRNQDKFLIRWLRSNEFGLDPAKNALSRFMIWQKEAGLSETILPDYMNKCSISYPVYIDGVDKQGRPIISYIFGQYNFLKIRNSYDLDEMKKYINHLFESTELYLSHNAGDNVTDTITIVDARGFDPMVHLCHFCTELYQYFVSTKETYFPHLSHKIFIITGPRSYDEPCSRVDCGEHGECVVEGHEGVCKCVPPYSGEAPNCRPACTADSDCPKDEFCNGVQCVDVCSGSCGVNAGCRAVYKSPVCSCLTGGGPFVECEPAENTNSSSLKNPIFARCGPNSRCKVSNGDATCSCNTKCIGEPPNCHPECINDNDCPVNKTCLKNKCLDLCKLDRICAPNAVCRMIRHRILCICQPYHGGDPHSGCSPYRIFLTITWTEAILPMVEPLFSQQTRNAINVLELDSIEQDSENPLLKQIDRNELFDIFGGSRALQRNKTLI